MKYQESGKNSIDIRSNPRVKTDNIKVSVGDLHTQLNIRVHISICLHFHVCVRVYVCETIAFINQMVFIMLNQSSISIVVTNNFTLQIL
jgi:hypothetical protein